MVAVDGLGIADVAVFVFMVAIVLVLWVLLQARAPIAGVPIVGATGVNLIDAIRTATIKLAIGMEQFLTWQQVQAQAAWNAFVNNLMTPALNGLSGVLTHSVQVLQAWAIQETGLLRLGLAQLQTVINGTVFPAVAALQLRAAADERYARDVLLAGQVATLAELHAAEVELEAVRGRLTATEGLLLETVRQVGVLIGFLPVLQALTGFEATTAAGVTVLERQVGLTQQQLKEFQDQLAKVLALAGITALGAVAIENLIRVARDPCTACGGTNVSDMEARLELVEAFGET